MVRLLGCGSEEITIISTGSWAFDSYVEKVISGGHRVAF
jgi:hypothetical protein